MSEKEKKCFKCNISKPLSSFYRHAKMSDGHLNKCKECTKTDVRKHRSENDSVRKYDRQRGNRQSSGYLKRYREINSDKYLAHNAVNNAIRDRKLFKPTLCEDCKEPGKLHGHHDDYSKPLEVRWLCPRCHSLFHSIYGDF